MRRTRPHVKITLDFAEQQTDPDAFSQTSSALQPAGGQASGDQIDRQADNGRIAGECASGVHIAVPS